MTITSWSTLIDAICDRMNDSALSSYAPEFVQMAEAMFNRRLYSLDMQGVATIPAAAILPVPSDYKGAMVISIDDDPPLTELSAGDFQQRWNGQTPARPENYSIYGNGIHLGPDPDSTYTVTMSYLRTLVPLTSTVTSNWLLEAHPDLYLYGALIHAEFRGWNDERLPLLNSAVEGMITEINAYDARRNRSGRVGVVAGEYF